jgi:hypothetical protein
MELKGKYESSYWSHKFARVSRTGLEESLQRIIKDLEKFKHFCSQITEAGGNIELFIGLYVKDSAGVCLSWQILGAASLLRIGLALDIYSEC